MNQTHSISRDACSCLCQCDDCLDALVIAADEEFTAVQALITSEAPLSKAKQLELCETIIEQYYLCLLESPLLFGIEIRSYWHHRST